ncbi:Pre-mRNA-splicing factor ATP-dependent RNA helicase DEAH1 [Gracilariopsis chorda]|uniref:Pre-mRNA-splicing factor ATP-dependent RNA helicase DEAH1 n=1 Tax=Gracilariopsis chorda TaxID=448386 RepID=A0A2V3IEL1_9FLOR|nr:Pre-mRNA-splicing factor ATP-dependent RNA helicase DEAH1 [Gracilariopsis chorda]|eukprot:PXF40525.1 Pre-mRNA-splicing factor ATP-dependent RNA helicase DEAH1 [Gracilariopsis chorda]
MPEALLRSLEHLYAVVALNDKGKPTKVGGRMAELPLGQMMATTLLASEKYKCSEEVTVICSMLSGNNAKNNHYRTLQNPHTVQIHPSSCFANEEIRPRWLIYHEILFTTKEFTRQVFDIEGNWLHEATSHFHKAEDVLEELKRKMPKVLGKAGAKVREA